MIANHFVIAISLCSDKLQIGVILLYPERDELESKMPPLYI